MTVREEVALFLKKREIVFREGYQEAENVHTFLFEKAEDLNWKAGQHGFFSITHKKIKRPMRPFSVASAPSENVIKLSVGIPAEPSEFKQAMLELKSGMKMSMRGPIGPLYLRDNGPSLLIAGGIGITPFRSILKELEHDPQGVEKQVTLFYLNHQPPYLFQEELDAVARHRPVDIHYLTAREELYREIGRFVEQHPQEATFYLGGPRKMVTSVSDYLKQSRIPNKKIKKDIFLGYK